MAALGYLLVGVVLQDELFQEEERPLVAHLVSEKQLLLERALGRTIGCVTHSPSVGAVQQIAKYP